MVEPIPGLNIKVTDEMLAVPPAPTKRSNLLYFKKFYCPDCNRLVNNPQTIVEKPEWSVVTCRCGDRYVRTKDIVEEIETKDDINAC